MIGLRNLVRARSLSLRPARSGSATLQNRRLASDWNAMAEAFIDSKASSIKRNNSSSAVVDSKLTTESNSVPVADTNEVSAVPESTPKNGPISQVFGKPILNDTPPLNNFNTSSEASQPINWSDSFHGLGSVSFGPRIQEILAEAIDAEDIEITPDGLLYLPEIKYRRVLNRAFGAGGWGLAPRSETMIQRGSSGTTTMSGAGTLTREYALICQGRLIGIARGEQDFFSEKGIPTASEGCKSNALMRCCKDLGIASELWDPKFIRVFKKKHCEEVFVEHVVNKRKKKIWKRKDGFVEYPFKKT